jgi:RNA polymerase sigma-70 factor (ECF subfamily)
MAVRDWALVIMRRASSSEVDDRRMWRQRRRRYTGSPKKFAAAMLCAMDSLRTHESDAEAATLACRIAGAAPERVPEAEAALYRRLAPRVRRYGLCHLRDAHAADDLMQHVLTLTLEQLRAGSLREPQRVVSYVLGACRLTVQEQRRVERRREALLAQHGELLEIADLDTAPALDHRRVADCLDQLPERERSVIVMSFWDAASSEDVSRWLGVSAGNVRVIRHRGLDKLRRCVEGVSP